jgi:hypothetical protein
MRRLFALARRWREVIKTRPRRGSGQPEPWEIEAFHQMTFNDVRRRSRAARSKAELGEPWHERFFDAAFVWRQLEAEMRTNGLWKIEELEPQRFKYWVQRIDVIDPDGIAHGADAADDPEAAASTSHPPWHG